MVYFSWRNNVSHHYNAIKARVYALSSLYSKQIVCAPIDYKCNTYNYGMYYCRH
jgi:hypothetical protein